MRQLAIALLLTFALPAWAAITPTDLNQCTATATSVTCTYNVAQSAGELLIANIAVINTGSTAYTLSVLDDVNGAWTKNAGCFSAFNGQSAQWYFSGTAAGTPTVTITSSTSAQMYVSIIAATGANTASPLDGAAVCGTSSIANPIVAPSITTGYAGSYILANAGYGGNPGAVSAASPYTAYGSSNGASGAYQIAGAPGTYTGASMTIQFPGSSAVPITGAYRAAGSPPPSSPTQFSLFMVGP